MSVPTHPDGVADGQASDQTSDLEQVVELEMKLLDPNMRGDVDGVQPLLHDYYAEYAASGQVYDRRTALQAPVEDSTSSLTVDRLEAELLAPGVVLVTYRAHRSSRASWRSSVWLQTEHGWQLRHQQATPIRD